MAGINENLRKAAVLIRSVDGDTAATLLAQLSQAEAAAVRQAMRQLGPIDPQEQAEVLAAFRKVGPTSAPSRAADGGVELSLSAPSDNASALTNMSQSTSATTTSRFDFLENAPTSALAPFLAREHAQTIAVVLANLAPARAAAVLAALPEKLQAEAIERLNALGDTDAESVLVLERELAAWFAKRTTGRGAGRREAVASILSAADTKTRDGILSNLRTHKTALANEIAPAAREREVQPVDKASAPSTVFHTRIAAPVRQPSAPGQFERRSPAPSSPPLPRIAFDELIHLDSRTLATVLGKMDANVLSLALAGSREELVDRICEQMPKRLARTFRKELRRLRPTRLSDVEAAQRAVADLAARELAKSRRRAIAQH